MALNLAPHLGDRALRGLAENLCESKRGDRLDERGSPGGGEQSRQELSMPLSDDVVQEPFRGSRQDEAAEAVDDEKQETHGQSALSSGHELDRIAKNDGKRGGFSLALLSRPGLSALGARKARAHGSPECSQARHVRRSQQSGGARDFEGLRACGKII